MSMVVFDDERKEKEFVEIKQREEEELIKFLLPRDLKRALQALANERNITLSALMRLMASEYVKRNQPT